MPSFNYIKNNRLKVKGAFREPFHKARAKQDGFCYLLKNGKINPNMEEGSIMKAWYVLGAALFLTACGGGGSSNRAAPEVTASPTVKFFQADNGANGRQLWKTDGTAAGTSMVKVINAGGNASIEVLGSLGSKTVFRANDGIHGQELWVTDGTEAGTLLLKDINAGTGGTYIPSFAIADGTLYFGAYDNLNGTELWKTDGTVAGTIMVKDIQPGINGTGVSNLVTMGTTVYFSASDGVAGYELWKSDGTVAGTVMVVDINPGALPSNISEMISVDGMLYFRADDGTHGQELWKSDGTAAGTELVKDIRPGTDPSLPADLVAMDGMIYFSAAESTAQGAELWRTDGTAAGTELVKNINTSTGGSTTANGANIDFMNAVNGKLFFTARSVSGGDDELWVSDGTGAGTMALFSTGNVNYLMVANDTVLFVGEDATYGQEMWTTDGTVAGTVLLKDIEPGASGSDFYSLGEDYFHENDAVPVVEVSPGVSLIIAYRSDIGSELWRTNGTAAGTRLIKDINPGMGDGF